MSKKWEEQTDEFDAVSADGQTIGMVEYTTKIDSTSMGNPNAEPLEGLKRYCTSALADWDFSDLKHLCRELVAAAAKSDPLKTDAIVVLTGGSGRLEEGLRLLSAGKATRMFVSGVYQGMDVLTLLQIKKRYPSGLENLIEIGNATNTTHNAIETAMANDRPFTANHLPGR